MCQSLQMLANPSISKLVIYDTDDGAEIQTITPLQKSFLFHQTLPKSLSIVQWAVPPGATKLVNWSIQLPLTYMTCYARTLQLTNQPLKMLILFSMTSNASSLVSLPQLSSSTRTAA